MCNWNLKKKKFAPEEEKKIIEKHQICKTKQILYKKCVRV